MKLKVKAREDNEAQEFKFKARAFKIETIVEIDISNLASLLPNESFSEWQEMLSEEHVEKVTLPGLMHRVVMETCTYMCSDIHSRLYVCTCTYIRCVSIWCVTVSVTVFVDQSWQGA